MEELEFRVLGPLEVLDKGEPLDLGGANLRGLLAILLLNAGEVVSSDRLISQLWNEQPPKTAAKSLQVLISQLRRTLEPQRAKGELGTLVRTRRPGYVLEIEREQLDLGLFERLAEKGREALASGDAELAAGTLREALELWRGPPLADLAYAAFAQGEISRLEGVRLAVLEDRIEADIERGRHAEVIGELQELIAAEPLRERPRAQLMLALYRSGRQAEALDVYREARRTLVDELGIEPGKELRELEAAVLSQDHSLDLAPMPANAPDEVEDARGVFVGREGELTRLSAGLDSAVAGRGSLFLLVGEPGIGKSRLAEEVGRRARAAGARVLVGRCWEAGGAPAYWPWVQSLRAYVEQVEPDVLREQLGGGGSEVAQIVPSLRRLFPDLPEPDAESEGARFRLFDSVVRLLRNAARARPITIVLDDLHAGDEPSLLLLRFLAGQLSDSRIFVVGTYRDVDPTVRDPLASTLAELAREQVTDRIELAGLSDADVARYMEVASGEPAPPGLVSAIHAETEGNPLFVGEVARLLSAEGRLADADADSLWSLGLPQGVREVIGRRLSRLSSECSRVLSLASVLGREVSIDALARLSEHSVDELLDVLDEAEEARVITAAADNRGRYRFGHALIRQTLYDQLTTPRRVQLHLRAGEVLEDLYAADLEPHLSELAHHFFEAAPAGQVDNALDYGKRAAEWALNQLAYEEAARFYSLALQSLELQQPVDAGQRCELLLAIGDAFARAGNTPEAKRTFAEAAGVARASNRPRQLALAALGYGGRSPWLRASGDERLIELLEEATATLGDTEPVLRVRLLARLAGALRDEPEVERRAALSREAVEIARGLADPYTLGYALVSHFSATWGPDDDLAGLAEEVTKAAAQAGNPELAVDACFVRREAWLYLGDRERVAAAAAEHRALAEELGQPIQRWYDVLISSNSALFEGRFADAERLADEALRVGRRPSDQDADIAYRLGQFALARERGGLDRLEGLIRDAADRFHQYRSFACLVALLECELGRQGDARKTFADLAGDDFAAFPRDGEWLFCLSVLAEVAAHLGDSPRAGILHKLLRPYGRLHALAWGETQIGCVARYLGLAAMTTGRWSESERHFSLARELNAAMGARPWVAHTEQDHARMLLARGAKGDRAQARELLTSALDTYRALGMEPWVKRAEPELAEAQSQG